MKHVHFWNRRRSDNTHVRLPAHSSSETTYSMVSKNCDDKSFESGAKRQLLAENMHFTLLWSHTLPLVVEDTRDWYEQNGSCFVDDELASNR